MKTPTAFPQSETLTWKRIRLEGDLTPTQARALLKLHFSADDINRMNELSAKAQAGALTDTDSAWLESYERLGCLLDVLHSQARRVLKRRSAS